MRGEPLEKMLESRVGWMTDEGSGQDIAISTRIRLARNLSDTPFPCQATPPQAANAGLAIAAAARSSKCLENHLAIGMDEVDGIWKTVLLERRLISRELANKNEKWAKVLIGDGETVSIMINEEDHIRLQAMMPGSALKKAWRKVNEIDDKLAAELPYAFDSQLGFLTSCPTNIGTGMRASVMLHLPALALDGQIQALIRGVGKLGLEVRGIFGEGSENLGNLHQVSNQSTLGESEPQIITHLESVINKIIASEKAARQKLLKSRHEFLLDHVGRAYGALRHAYILSSEEALSSLSALRAGVGMGMFKSIDMRAVNELFITTQPGHLQKLAGRPLDAGERDILRAKLAREEISGKRAET